jgi:hypothetical protein
MEAIMAANNPSNWNAVGYNEMITRTVQVYGGEMRRLSRLATGNLYREKGIYPRISGGGLPTLITNRAPTTPNSEPEYSNRAVTRGDYHDAVIVDRQDLDRMVADPRYEKNQILLDKFALLEDVVYQQAALGVAKGGEKGATDAQFDTTNNIIAVGTGAPSGITSTGWNYEKQKATIAQFGKNNVKLANQKPCFVMSWAQWEDMMDDDKYINRDYTDKVVGDRGGIYIPDYMGCEFIVYQQVPFMNTAGTGFQIDDTDLDSDGVWNDTDGSEVRAVIATTKDSTLLEIKPDVITETGKNPQLSYRLQTYMEMGLGAVRMEEEKVIVVPCDENPS